MSIPKPLVNPSPFHPTGNCKFARTCISFQLLLLLSSHSVVWLFWDPMDCSPPGASVHEISQVRPLEWVAISFFRESSWPRDRTHVSRLPGRFFTTEPSGKARRQIVQSFFLLAFIVWLFQRLKGNNLKISLFFKKINLRREYGSSPKIHQKGERPLVESSVTQCQVLRKS